MASALPVLQSVHIDLDMRTSISVEEAGQEGKLPQDPNECLRKADEKLHRILERYESNLRTGLKDLQVDHRLVLTYNTKTWVSPEGENEQEIDQHYEEYDAGWVTVLEGDRIPESAVDVVFMKAYVSITKA